MTDFFKTASASLFRKTLFCIGFLSLPVAADAQIVTNGTFTGVTGNSVTPPGWTNALGHNPDPLFGSTPSSVDVLDPAFSAWSGASAVTASPSPQGGTWCGLSSIGSAADGWGENEAVEQTISGLVVGQQYQISYYAANFGGSPFNGAGKVLAFLDGNQIATSPTLALQANVWVTVTGTFTATASSGILQIDVVEDAIGTPGAPGGYYSVDDVKIEPVNANPGGCDFTVDLGNDTTFCQGQGLLLNAGAHDSYLWDNNSTNQTRYVTLPGTYHVQVGEIGQNLIVNGDFEAGNSDFTTSYTLGVGGSFGPLSNEGTYAVTSSPNLVHTNFSSCQDHTPAPGVNMMVVNGSGTANTNVWCQTVPVDPNTDYQFSTWTSSALNDPNVAQLQFNINSTLVGSVFSPPSTGCQWAQFYQVWNSGANTSAQICIVNQNTGTSGNDFCLDDISFSPLCFAYDTIVIGNYPSPVITASPNDTICAGENAQLIASSSTPNLTYTWNPGNINGSTLNISPAASTIYSVTAVSPEGCVSNNVNRSVIVRPMPTASIFINGNDTICNGFTSLLDATTGGVPATLLWSTSETTAQIAVTPSVTTSYTLEATSAFGCVDDTTVTIYVIPDLDVDISGQSSFCEGDGVTLTATSNMPNTSFYWPQNGQNTAQINIDGSYAGQVYVIGSYYVCPEAIDSIEITVIPNPTVIPPADVTVCPGEAVSMTVSSDQPGSSFFWSGGLSGPTNTLVANQTTTYYVYAQNGACVSPTAQFTINVSAACFLTVPNVFTPNGDLTNDFFELASHEGILSLDCVILNRWGNVIREFDSPDFQWDGTDKSGNRVSEGVYFYKITAITNALEELNETGMVELVE